MELWISSCMVLLSMCYKNWISATSHIDLFGILWKLGWGNVKPAYTRLMKLKMARTVLSWGQPFSWMAWRRFTWVITNTSTTTNSLFKRMSRQVSITCCNVLLRVPIFCVGINKKGWLDFKAQVKNIVPVHKTRSLLPSSRLPDKSFWNNKAADAVLIFTPEEMFVADGLCAKICAALMRVPYNLSSRSNSRASLIGLQV